VFYVDIRRSFTRRKMSGCSSTDRWIHYPANPRIYLASLGEYLAVTWRDHSVDTASFSSIRKRCSLCTSRNSLHFMKAEGNRVHKRSPLDIIQNHRNPVRTLIFYLIKIYFNIIISSIHRYLDCSNNSGVNTSRSKDSCLVDLIFRMLTLRTATPEEVVF
jgi:hypothetical protein